MLASARRHGAEIVCDTPVTGWQQDGASILLATAARDFRASRVILSAGAWIGRLLRCKRGLRSATMQRNGAI